MALLFKTGLFLAANEQENSPFDGGLCVSNIQHKKQIEKNDAALFLKLTVVA